MTVLWAVLVGAGLKFVLTEGIARWQIATGQTVLEGALLRLGRPARWLFLLYLLPWSWFVGSAMISGCGATVHALVPWFDDAATGKAVFGPVCSLVGLVLVSMGGYRWFERVMRVCILLMFITVVVTTVLLGPDWAAVLRGLVVPTIVDGGGAGLGWTIALIGGVGGTLTVLCYGYWLREEDRDGREDLAGCRLDLAVGYLVTAVFGIAMVVIGSCVDLDGSGAGLLVRLADLLEERLGTTARWVFLLGAFGAVFSSLLGVWQAVPYVFADFYRLVAPSGGAAVDPRSAPYRAYLWGLALVPMAGLALPFKDVQKLYAVVGAFFLPLLALTLLLLNGPRRWVGDLRNGVVTNVVLVVAVLFFAALGLRDWLF